MQANFETLLRANAIFKGIPLNDLSSLTEHASVVELDVRDHIYSAEEQINNIYFPNRFSAFGRHANARGRHHRGGDHRP